MSRFRSGIFFFIGVINVHINLCIKLCPPLVRIYCSDCLQQKRPNQNLFFRHISRERGPTHHFCVTSNHHLIYYAGCPEGAYRVLKRVDFFFFFFVVYTNRYINLFIKLSPLLLGMYCFDCLQQKQANQNPFLSLILRGRGPTHPYLCDVNASFDIFIKDGLSRAILF